MKRKSEMQAATVATRKQYSETTIQWAQEMLLQGFAPAYVAQETGIDGGYVRTLKFRLGAKEMQPARVHDSEILREFVALKPVTETETPAPTAAQKAENTRFSLSTLDIVFYTTTATACAGFVTAFHWWGLPVSLVYTLILVDAMGMAKDVTLQKTAERGGAAVIVFEIIAGFAHTYVFNSVMWANYKSLPFEIEQVIRGGEVTWNNGDKPFFVAVCIAVILSASAVYAVDTTIKKTRERVKNAAK